MKLTFLGTGPAKAISRSDCPCPTCQDARKAGSRSRRLRSSLLIQTAKAAFLIDCSPDFLIQIKKIKAKEIKAIFLTHGHWDAVGGLKFLNQWTKNMVSVFTHQADIPHFNNLSFKNLKFQSVGKGQKIKIADLMVEPFEVFHGLGARPTLTLGYLLNQRAAYASDFGDLPLQSQNMLKNLPLAIFDATMYFNREMKGHLEVSQSIAWAEKLKIKKLYLTHLGHFYPPHEQAEKEIQNFLRKNYSNNKLVVILGYDGLKINI